jgi:hypothetical protein
MLSFQVRNIINSVGSIGESCVFVPRMPNVNTTSTRIVALNPEEYFLVHLFQARQKYTTRLTSLRINTMKKVQKKR